ncbi:hypothetical protein [Pseudonocardia sp. H11422]|uniref:hypothetical protein n=1 Tax=Pseudonocardia sp. H11422 TaxID=2835866 RepID=UPI001BDC9F51|nr:hypothetical protein [Pseudonocardia sp. H11422]
MTAPTPSGGLRPGTHASTTLTADAVGTIRVISSPAPARISRYSSPALLATHEREQVGLRRRAQHGPDAAADVDEMPDSVPWTLIIIRSNEAASPRAGVQVVEEGLAELDGIVGITTSSSPGERAGQHDRVPTPTPATRGAALVPVPDAMPT